VDDGESEDAGDLDGDDLRGGELPGALHAIELRDGAAISYLSRGTEADAGIFWHARSVLALPETGVPLRYTRFLEQQEFAGSLKVPIASHARRVAADGGRVLFTVDDRNLGSGGDARGEEGGNVGAEDGGIWLLIGEWDAAGAFLSAQAVSLERATWQHDIGVTEGHVVFIESPTAPLQSASSAPVPFAWVPGAEGWLGVVERAGNGEDVRWFRFDPALVTHVLGAWEERAGPGSASDLGIVLYVCVYQVPEPGRPFDSSASVLGPMGIGLSPIGGSLAVLERWQIAGDRLERSLVDERWVEYPRMDATCEGSSFRYGYCVQNAWASDVAATGTGVAPLGLLKFDLRRDEVAAWTPGPFRTASEPIFVRARDGRSDDEGWLLTVVDDANRGASDLWVLDASSLGRRGPEAVIHLPERLPFRSHGEWVPADRYR
jgi:carotenoid cleavage dioxygenase-like enzyme